MEEKEMKLLNERKEIVNGKLKIWEECPDNEDFVMLDLFFNSKHYKSKQENFFDALLELRKMLEKEGVQILCNGAAKNVYPSSMQRSMGTCLKAYKMKFSKSALNDDIVDIFAFDKNLEYVSVDKQYEFYRKWLESIRKN